MGWSANRLERFEAVEPHMGSLAGITLFARNAAEAKAAFAAAYGRIAELDRILSDYRADSELNALSTQPREVSRELESVLRFALELSRRTNGAFDVTVGPMSRLWRQRAPITAEARALVDWRALYVRGGRAWLGREGMRLDLGAIGKGFAADEALRTLRKMGIDRALVAASGDIVCGEAPPGTRGWTVAAGGRRLLLRRAAVSTSGDTEQYFERDGQRYSHILDPRAGASVTGVLEAAVVAPRGMVADALATSTRVIGLEAGRLLARRYRAVVL